jgi:hypothetical protein
MPNQRASLHHVVPNLNGRGHTGTDSGVTVRTAETRRVASAGACQCWGSAPGDLGADGRDAAPGTLRLRPPSEHAEPAGRRAGSRSGAW